MISAAQSEVKRGFLYEAPGSQSVPLPQSGRVNFAPEMTSNLYDYRSAGVGQHYFPDETVDEPGPSHAPKTAPVSLSFGVKYDNLFLPSPELSKFSGDPLEFKLFISTTVTLKRMSSPDCKTKEHFFVYLFSIVRIRLKKRYNIFLKQVKIVINWLRIAFLRNMDRRGSCQISANKDSRNSLRLFQVMQRN